jgi:hypothetical protein
MKCIIDKLPADKIISPAKLSDKADKTIGLYPDRVFVEGEVEQELLDKAFETFAKELGFTAVLVQKLRMLISVMANIIFSSKRKYFKASISNLCRIK